MNLCQLMKHQLILIAWNGYKQWRSLKGNDVWELVHLSAARNVVGYTRSRWELMVQQSEIGCSMFRTKIQNWLQQNFLPYIRLRVLTALSVGFEYNHAPHTTTELVSQTLTGMEMSVIFFQISGGAVTWKSINKAVSRSWLLRPNI